MIIEASNTPKKLSSIHWYTKHKDKEFHLLPAETEEGGKGLEKENLTLQGLEPFPNPSWWLP